MQMLRLEQGKRLLAHFVAQPGMVTKLKTPSQVNKIDFKLSKMPNSPKTHKLICVDTISKLWNERIKGNAKGWTVRPLS